MYQIKVNGVLVGTIYYTYSAALDACQEERNRAPYAIMTEIVCL